MNFRIWVWERTIGSIKECSGLYLRTNNNSPSGQALHVVSSVPHNSLINVSDNDIILWYFLFGIPIFLYLKKVFPSLLKIKNPKLFQCDVCQILKHSRNLFLSHPYKPSHPFTIFHSDVWRLTHVKYVVGFCKFAPFINDHTCLTWIFFFKRKVRSWTSLSKFSQNDPKSILNKNWNPCNK